MTWAVISVSSLPPELKTQHSELLNKTFAETVQFRDLTVQTLECVCVCVCQKPFAAQVKNYARRFTFNTGVPCE